MLVKTLHSYMVSNIMVIPESGHRVALACSGCFLACGCYRSKIQCLVDWADHMSEKPFNLFIFLKLY